MRECQNRKLELDRRFLCLPWQYYRHRSTKYLQYLEKFYYQQLGFRSTQDIVTLVSWSSNTQLNATSQQLFPDSVFGISPTVRIIASTFPQLDSSNLSSVFLTNQQTVETILSTQDIIISAMF